MTIGPSVTDDFEDRRNKGTLESTNHPLSHVEGQQCHLWGFSRVLRWVGVVTIGPSIMDDLIDPVFGTNHPRVDVPRRKT